jgi:hypothetical protein
VIVKHSVALLLALEVLCSPALAAAKGTIREVSVARTRVQIADVLPLVAPDAAAIDLGPAPAPGGSRLVTRDDLRRAFEGARSPVPAALPEAVRVVRKMTHLTAADIERIARAHLDASTLPRGATIAAVRAGAPADVPAGWDAIRLTLPARPHHAGLVRSLAVLTFTSGVDTLAALTVPVDLALTVEGAAYDLTKGGSVRVVVHRGSIEIEAAAIATADADVGGVLAVMLRASGRIVRARLVDKDHAELVEGG